MLVAQFKFWLFNALPQNPEVSGERLQGHYGPIVSLIWCHFYSILLSAMLLPPGCLLLLVYNPLPKNPEF